MTNQSIFLIPVWESISTAWEKTKGVKGTVWAAIGIIVLIAIGFTVLSSATHSISALQVIINFIGQVIIFLLEMGLLYLGIQRAFDLVINYRQVFHSLQGNVAINLIGLYVLKFLVLLPTFILFVVAATLSSNYSSPSVPTIIAALLNLIAFIALIYLSVRMVLGTGFVLEKNVNSWQALKMTFKATRDNFWRLIGIYIIQFFIVAISIIPLGIGLIWTLPFILVLYGVVYRRLSVNV